VGCYAPDRLDRTETCCADGILRAIDILTARAQRTVFLLQQHSGLPCFSFVYQHHIGEIGTDQGRLHCDTAKGDLRLSANINYRFYRRTLQMLTTLGAYRIGSSVTLR
jgi:hypothetical protein